MGAKRIVRIWMALLWMVVILVGANHTHANTVSYNTASSNATSTCEELTITILHTNDMHGAIEELGYVKSLKDAKQNCILVDAGDPTQGSALAGSTKGSAVIELMNAATYDVMTAGNHEFDFGTTNAISLAKLAHFPILSANALGKDGTPVFANENSNGMYTVIEKQGIKVGFFGITSTETTFKTNPNTLEGVTFAKEIDVAKEQVAMLKALGADVIVAIVHMGTDATSDPTSHTLAKEVPGIDILIDGHSHTIDQSVIGKTHVVQTGTKLASVGEITITLHREYSGNTSSSANTSNRGNVSIIGTATTVRIVAISNTLLPMEQIKKQYSNDEGVKRLYDKLMQAQDARFGKKVVDLNADILGYYNRSVRASRVEETPLGSLIADAMKEAGRSLLTKQGKDYTGYPVVAIFNGGSIRADLIGTVTVGSIADVLPFANGISVVEITPSMLYQTLEHGYHELKVDEKGFLDIDSADGAFAQISGMRVELDLEKPKGSRVTGIYVDDGNVSEKMLERNDTTTKLALVSYDYAIAGGDGYTTLATLNHLVEGGNVDQILQEYMQKHAVDGVFTYAHTSNRIQVKQLNQGNKTNQGDKQEEPIYQLVTQIKLEPCKKIEVLIDGQYKQIVSTNEEGDLVLQQIPGGMHTITIEGKSYYISSFTKLGIKQLISNLANYKMPRRYNSIGGTIVQQNRQQSRIEEVLPIVHNKVELDKLYAWCKEQSDLQPETIANLIMFAIEGAVEEHLSKTKGTEYSIKGQIEQFKSFPWLMKVDRVKMRLEDAIARV